MADSSIIVTEGSGKAVDTRTNAAGDHRQVVVLGNPTATDSVAEVQATDPSSSALGVVVREPNSTAIVAGLRDVRVQSIVDGTVSVNTVENITRVKNVVDGTLTTITGVDRVRNVVDGTLSVVTFIPAVQRVQNLVDGTLTTVTGVDRVRNVVDGTLTTVTGVDRIRNIVDGTISTVTSLGTATRVDRVMNLVDGTVSTVTFVPVVQRVQNLVDGTLTTVTNVTTVASVTNIANTVEISAPDGTFAVRFSPSTPNVAILSNAQPIGNSGVVGATTQRVVHAVDIVQSMNIMAIGTTNTLGVYLSATAGTLNVQLKPGAVLVNDSSTAGIFTVSGTTSTAGNNTLVAPSASYNFKVYAYSLQTTGLVSSAPRFTTGASAGATELWRPLINSVQASSAPIGANLAISPPGYIFATGVSTTLALYLDTGTLIHYSVSFIKESA